MNNRMVGLALLAGGLVLLVWGIQASDSFASHFSKFFTGHPTDKAIWMVIGGVVLSTLGLGSLYSSRT